jgi:hypothetical protein
LRLPSCKGAGASEQDLRIECVPHLTDMRSHECQCFSGDKLLNTFGAGRVPRLAADPVEALEGAAPVCDDENPEFVLRSLLASYCGLLTYYYTDFDEVAY